jgi:hypothetical protein
MRVWFYLAVDLVGVNHFRFAGSQFPKAIFPSMVGRPVLRSDEKVQGIQIKDIMVGDDASKARQNLKINLPMGMPCRYSPHSLIVRKWTCQGLGRHYSCVELHFPRETAHQSDWMQNPAHRATRESDCQSQEDVADDVRDVWLQGRLRRHSGYSHSLCSRCVLLASRRCSWSHG